jgi:hypothetical protein
MKLWKGSASLARDASGLPRRTPVNCSPVERDSQVWAAIDLAMDYAGAAQATFGPSLANCGARLRIRAPRARNAEP